MIDDDIDEDFLDNFNEDDYLFVVDAHGELKLMMAPDNLMEEPPKSIKKILKIFKIKDLHQLETKIIH